MPENKKSKMNVRDLKPKKDAKGGIGSYAQGTSPKSAQGTSPKYAQGSGPARSNLR